MKEMFIWNEAGMLCLCPRGGKGLFHSVIKGSSFQWESFSMNLLKGGKEVKEWGNFQSLYRMGRIPLRFKIGKLVADVEKQVSKNTILISEYYEEGGGEDNKFKKQLE